MKLVFNSKFVLALALSFVYDKWGKNKTRKRQRKSGALLYLWVLKSSSASVWNGKGQENALENYGR